MGTFNGRVAMVSLHTSPLDQPGVGDAGGMNVYVDALARALGRCGVGVDVFTRATPRFRHRVDLADNVVVRPVFDGPIADVDKHVLASRWLSFAGAIIRTLGRSDEFAVVHSHYWLSGRAGAVAASRWQIPLVHSMHTMGKVKNAHLAPGDTPEPEIRLRGEQKVVDRSSALVAATAREAEELTRYYGARPERIHVVPPGVDRMVFRPDGSTVDEVTRAEAVPGSRSGLVSVGDGRASAPLVVFAGRQQPLKGPDVLLRAMAEQVSPQWQRTRLVMIGGPSGVSDSWLPDLATSLGVQDRVLFVPPQSRQDLARWFRSADVVAVPSYSETFGLVALEAQACGTPVVAADVGGLSIAVSDGVSGVLVPDHEPLTWARAIDGVLQDHQHRHRLAAGALAHASGFGWDAIAEQMIEVYAAVTRADVRC